MGVGTLDVREYYASVDLEILRSQLAGAPPGAVDALIRALQALPEVGGLSGLPIGFEGSGVLGNLYLLPADAVWSPRVGLVRWTDDSWLFLRDRSDWPEALHEYDGLLSALALATNRDKCGFYEKETGQARAAMSSGAIDSILAESDGVVDPGVAFDTLTWQLDLPDDERDNTLVNFAMSCLKSARYERIPQLVTEHPELWRVAPKAAGDLVATVANDPDTRRTIDVDSLIERACDSSDDPTLFAGRLHSCRAAAHLRPGRRAGECLFDLVTRGSAHPQLSAAAARAWASSDYWKPGRAMEAALSRGHLTLRRSLVAGFRHRADYRRRSNDWKRLSREDPDLRPTLAWAED